MPWSSIETTDIETGWSMTLVSRIMSKLDARDRAQLVVIAYETGLVTSPSRGR